MTTIKLAVDALGGDKAPDLVLKGVAAALKERDDIRIILVGPATVVEPFCTQHEHVTSCVSTQTIEMDEQPASAVRKKKDSSIVLGCRLVKEGRADGFFSAGSTGAVLAAATLFIGRLKGILRPAIVSDIPSPVAQVVFADMGANADCKPEYLVQFAHMGRVYAQAVCGIADPSVGLLNIGEEDSKGSSFVRDCHALMRKQVPHFLGNAEGKNLALGGFDVLVSDGFTGNVALKVYEGALTSLVMGLKQAYKSSVKTKIAGLMSKDALSALARRVSAETRGGAQLLGIKGVCMIGHGSSNENAIKNGILTTATAVEKDIVARLSSALDLAKQKKSFLNPKTSHNGSVS